MGNRRVSLRCSAILGLNLASALLLVAGCGGGGFPAQGEERVDSPTVSISRPWIVVPAPNWHEPPDPSDFATRPDGAVCVASSGIRACFAGDELALESYAPAPGLWGLRVVGEFRDSWLFHDARAGRHYRALGFTGPLEPLPPIGRQLKTSPWESARPVQISGLDELWVWNGQRLERADLPGRVLDATFVSANSGLAVVEPGALFSTEDGGGQWRQLDLGDFIARDLRSDELASRLRAAGLWSREEPLVSRYRDRRTYAARLRWTELLRSRLASDPSRLLPAFVTSHQASLVRSGWMEEDMAAESCGRRRPFERGWWRSCRTGAEFVSRDLRSRYFHLPEGRRTLMDGDGRAALRFQLRESCADDSSAAQNVAPGEACYATEVGRSLLLLGEAHCASILELHQDVLFAGGSTCPIEVCDEYAFVQARISGDEKPRFEPVPYDGPPIDWNRSSDPRQRRDCHLTLRGHGVTRQDAGELRLVVPGIDGPMLVVGRIGGRLRALPLPDSVEHVDFGDEAHGIAVSTAEPFIWLTDDGGRSWRPMEGLDAPAHGDDSRWAGYCFPGGCVIGAAYWMDPSLARRLALVPGRPLDTGPYRRDPSDSRAGSFHPWAREHSPRWPALRVRPVFPPITPREVRRFRAGSVNGALVGQAVDAETRRSWVFVWKGVEPDGDLFDSGLVRVRSDAEASPSHRFDYLEAVAATRRFAVFMDYHSGANPHVDLVVVDRHGEVRRTSSPLRQAMKTIALPLPSGGLGLLFGGERRRFLVELSDSGAVLNTRESAGPYDMRNEWLATDDGHFGRLVVDADGESATQYTIHGAVRRIRMPAGPTAPCSAATGRARMRIAGVWHAPDERDAPWLSEPPVPWWLVEDSEDGLCLRLGHVGRSFGESETAETLSARGGQLTGWSYDIDGEAEIGPAAAGAPRRPQYRALGHVSIAADEQGVWASHSMRHMSGPQTRRLWRIDRLDGSVRERSIPGEADRAFVSPPILTRNSAFVSREAAFALEGGNVRRLTSPSNSGPYLMIVHDGRDRTLALTPTGLMRWDRVGDELVERTVPWPRSTGRSPEVIDFGFGRTSLYVLTGSRLDGNGPTRRIRLELHRLEEDGEFERVGAVDTQESQLWGDAWTTFVTEGEDGIYLAYQATVQSEMHVLRVTGEPLVAPAPATRIGGPEPAGMLALGVDPLRLAWVEAPIGRDEWFVRVAEYLDGQWRELSSPHRISGDAHFRDAAQFHGDSLWVMVSETDGLRVHQFRAGRWTVRALGPENGQPAPRR